MFSRISYWHRKNNCIILKSNTSSPLFFFHKLQRELLSCKIMQLSGHIVFFYGMVLSCKTLYLFFYPRYPRLNKFFYITFTGSHTNSHSHLSILWKHMQIVVFHSLSRYKHLYIIDHKVCLLVSFAIHAKKCSDTIVFYKRGFGGISQKQKKLTFYG